MPARLTLALCLLVAPTYAAAEGVTPVCVRDGDHIGCTWAVTQTIELPRGPELGESPVPACIDCVPDAPPTVELDCALTIDAKGSIDALCQGNGWDASP